MIERVCFATFEGKGHIGSFYYVQKSWLPNPKKAIIGAIDFISGQQGDNYVLTSFQRIK